MLQMIIQVVILALYLLLMLLIGFGFYNTNNSLNDYFLGDRGLNKWVAAMLCSGVGYERLAADGLAGNCVFGVWRHHRGNLDGCRLGNRYIS